MKARYIEATGQLILDLLKGDVRPVENALPGDVRFLAAYFDPEKDCFLLKVESETYEETGEGGQYIHDRVGVESTQTLSPVAWALVRERFAGSR